MKFDRVATLTQNQVKGGDGGDETISGSGKVGFRLLNGSQSPFSVNSSSRELIADADLDAEQLMTSYDVVIETYDLEKPQKFTWTTITVYIDVSTAIGCVHVLVNLVQDSCKVQF